MFIAIDTGFNMFGNRTNKGVRQFTHFKIDEIKAYRICSTGKKVEIYIAGLNWVLTQFDTVSDFEESIKKTFKA